MYCIQLEGPYSLRVIRALCNFRGKDRLPNFIRTPLPLHQKAINDVSILHISTDILLGNPCLLLNAVLVTVASLPATLLQVEALPLWKKTKVRHKAYTSIFLNGFISLNVLDLNV